MINLIESFLDKESENVSQETFSRNEVKHLLHQYDLKRNNFHIGKRAEQIETIRELKEQVERYEEARKYKGSKARIALRCLAFVFALGLLCITHLYFAFKRSIEFLKFGGEFTKYSDEKEYKTINDIYQLLKTQNKTQN